MAVDIVGIAWYRAADYDRLKAMFEDGEKLPDTFEDWLREVQKVWVELTTSGIRVEKAYIDPVAFPEWCKDRGVAMDEHARLRYAIEYASRIQGARDAAVDRNITTG